MRCKQLKAKRSGREFFKDLPKTQPELFTRDNETGLYYWIDNNQGNYTLPKIDDPTSKASAGYYMYDLSIEEEKYEPGAYVNTKPS